MSTFNVNNIDHDSVEIDRLQIIPTHANNPRIRRRSVSPSRLHRDLASVNDDAEHFLNKTPLVAKSQFDDDDKAGVDEPFFTGETIDILEDGSHASIIIDRNRRPSYTPSNFPYSPGFGPGVVDVPNTDVNVNMYQQKKTLAQGMMDLALLSANANQLRYVLESYKRHPYYYPSVVFISLSLFFQIVVGIGLIVNCKYDVTNKKEIWQANRINNLTVIGIFIVTVVNVFISAFGVAEAPRENMRG